MTTRDEIVAMRKAAEDEAEHVLQCCGEYHPNYHEVADAIFFREAQRQAYERAAEVCETECGEYFDGYEFQQPNNHDCAAAIRDLIEGVEK